MERTVTLRGRVLFEPKNHTKKHEKQGVWKKVAMIVFDESTDLVDYYSWFLKKRFNLELNRPIRGAHVTFVNDRANEMNGNWEYIKSKWNNKEIDVTVFLEPRSDGKYWWLAVPEEHRKQLHDIRATLGMGRPNWGLHMTIGFANEKNINHSNYIDRLIKNGLISFDN